MHRSNAFETDYGSPLWLTTQQLAIVASKAPSAIVSALAGTGKTTTLACCAVQALREQPLTRILVLAYTNAGVQAFKHRLQMLIHTLPRNVQITTLERWCARTLRQRDPAVRFLTDPLELRQQAQQALLQLEAQLQRQPDPRVELPIEIDAPSFWAFDKAAKKSLMLQRMREDGYELAEFCEQHLLDYSQARLFSAYERLRTDDCGDTRYYAEGDCTYALAQEDAPPFQAPYDLVLFDEMHDLDLASLRVLRQILASNDARFLGAGDFNQHIEAQAWSVFQDKLHQLADFLPRPTQSLPLTQSRRFGPEIAEAINAWLHVDMRSTANRRSSVIHASYESDAQCMDLLMRAQASITNAASPIPLTVILRHAHDACALEWAIYRAGKSVSLHGMQPLYLHRDVALLLGLMYAHGLQASDWKSQTCALGIELLAAFIDGALYFGKGQVASALPDRQLHVMAAQMHAHPQGIWGFLIGESSLQGGARNFKAFGNFLSLPLHLQHDAHALLQQTDLQGLFTAVPMPVHEREQLQTRVRSLLAATQGLTVAQVLDQIAGMQQRHQKQLRQGREFDFQLLSIEQAKGQEFEYVALPFIEPGRFPAPVPQETAFLERNRLYVAMTRAKHRLWLFTHAQRPIQAVSA